MRNLGPVSTKWLAAIGIRDIDTLRQVGAIEAFRLVKQHDYPANLNFLYALEGAVRDCHWQALDDETREQLKRVATQLRTNKLDTPSMR